MPSAEVPHEPTTRAGAAVEGPVAVTGAGGYLGGRLVTALGSRARALVRSPVSWLPESSQQMCDLLGRPSEITTAIAASPVIVHLAGHNEVVARSEPDRAIQETVAMAEHLVDAARASGSRRLVYVSTVHVYGGNLRPGAIIDESVDAAPTSPYAEARAQCEAVLAGATDLDVAVLRLTNAVGAPADPGVDRWTLVASELCMQGVLDRVLTLRSSGAQSRDFITLDDAVRIVIGTCDPSSLPPATYNLSSGRSATVRSLAELIQDRVEEMCGWRPRLDAPDHEGPLEEPYVVDPGRLASHGLVAKQTLRDGVDEIIDHCRKHETALRQLWRTK